MTGLVEYRVPPMPERRDPTAATKPTGWQGKGQPMVSQWDAANAFEWGYLANTFVKACIDAIADDLSRLPLRVGTPPPTPGGTGTWSAAHPLARAFGPPPGGPNPQTSARKLLRWSVVQYLTTGRLGWEIELPPGGGPPVAYWPLPAQWLKPIAAQGGARYFDGFEYGPANVPTRLPAERVFYLHDPAPDDWRQAVPKIQAARLDISIAVMQDRYDYAFLSNDSTPATVVTHERFAVKEERDAWRRQFLARHRGPANAGRAIFVEADAEGGNVAGSIDVKQLGMSAKDARSRELYDAKVKAICVAIGVPVSRLGDSSDRTFSNAGQEWSNYWQGTLLPIALDFADAMAMQLLPLYGATRGVPYFDTSGVAALQEAQPAPADIPNLVAAGVVLPAEARGWLGLDPSTELPAPPALPPPATGAAAPKAEARGVLGPAETEARAATIWRNADAVMTTLEIAWRAALQKLFRRQERATLDRLEGKRGRQLVRAGGPAGQVFDPGFWTATTADIVDGLYSQVFAAGGARVAAQFGIAFDLQQVGVQDKIAQRAHDLAGQVSDTTYRAIRDELTAGTALGEGIPELAGRVRAVFADAGDRRATTIARTEVVSAYNGAQYDVAQQLPADVVGGQEWIATRDGRTRPEHLDADGQIVATDESFDVGGESLDYPGDEGGSAANTVNCRCTIAFLSPDEYQARTGNEPPMHEPAPAPDAADIADTITDPNVATAAAKGYRDPSSLSSPLLKQPSRHGIPTGPATPVKSGKVLKAHTTAMRALDGLLRIPEHVIDGLSDAGLQQIPVRVGGQARGTTGTFWRGRTVAFGVSLKADTAGPVTAAHEFTHFLDFADMRLESRLVDGTTSAIPFASQRGHATDAWKAVYDAWENSNAVQSFRSMARESGRNWTSHTGHIFSKPSREQIRSYWLNEQELFARSVSQWAAVRSGDPEMLADLAKYTEHGFPAQWADDDFEPIGKALDDLFTYLGVLK